MRTAKPNEVTRFAPLLERLNLTGCVSTANARHAQRDDAEFIVAGKGANYVLVVKKNQPSLYSQFKKLPWRKVPVLHDNHDRVHSRQEHRTLKVVTVSIRAAQASCITRRVRPLTGATWRTIHAVTSLTAEQASPLTWPPGSVWGIEALHHITDVTYGQDHSQVRTANGPASWPLMRNLIIGLLRVDGYENIAAALRRRSRDAFRTLIALCLTPPWTESDTLRLFTEDHLGICLDVPGRWSHGPGHYVPAASFSQVVDLVRSVSSCARATRANPWICPARSASTTASIARVMSAYLEPHDKPSSRVGLPIPATFGETREAGPPATTAINAEEAVLYLRVSDKKQMATDADYDPEGNSIPTQRRIAQAKADTMGVIVTREYVEPGRSAISIEKRVAFQEMMADIRDMPNVRYVIVYMMNRAFRNALEELATKAQLAKMGITLVSAKENFGNGYLGDAMQGMLAIFNELQSRANGEDVKTKMHNKARNGGTVGRAPLGYLNVGDSSLGHEVRTVNIDPVRGPLVRLAFELYATGDYALADLSDELYNRGLRTRPRNGPAQKVNVSKLSRMLRDRYYIGIVTFKSEEHPGRHEPLVSPGLFERVQDIIETRATAQERRRVHHHYLKGSLFCGACAAKGITQRMIMQQTVSHSGTVYLYFFCRGNQNGTCNTPHIPVYRLEEAVEDHYAPIRFNSAFIAQVREHLTTALNEEKVATQLRRDQITAELKTLDGKEENLLDLAADGDLPKGKIKTRLRDIEHRRQHLTGRLGQITDDLSEAARVIEMDLELLENPQALYLRCNEKQRRMFNQAIFHALYVEADTIISDALKEPFGIPRTLQKARQAASPQDTATAPVPDTGKQTAKARQGRNYNIVVTGAQRKDIDMRKMAKVVLALGKQLQREK